MRNCTSLAIVCRFHRFYFLKSIFAKVWEGRVSWVVRYPQTLELDASVSVDFALFHCFNFIISELITEAENCGNVFVWSIGWLRLLNIGCRPVQCLPVLASPPCQWVFCSVVLEKCPDAFFYLIVVPPWNRVKAFSSSRVLSAFEIFRIWEIISYIREREFFLPVLFVGFGISDIS